MMLRIAMALCLGLVATSAAAHIRLDFPTPRTSSQKFGPCGITGSERGDDVTVFRAGETITVRWTETIDHPSHYRIAFDPNGHDGFVDPPAMMDAYSNELVLLDLIEDRSGGEYSAEITLPDVACDRCTLQLIQVMYDKPPYTVPGNDLYYQCADVVLVREENDAGVTDAGDTDAGGLDAGHSDAGRSDAGPARDAGDDPDPDHDHDAAGGCSCRATPSAAATLPWWLALGALIARRTRPR